MIYFNDKGLRTLKERRDVLCMKYFAEIQRSAHKLNGLLPTLRKVDYDLRPGFNRYPLSRYRTNRYGNSLIPWGLGPCSHCYSGTVIRHKFVPAQLSRNIGARSH